MASKVSEFTTYLIAPSLAAGLKVQGDQKSLNFTSTHTLMKIKEVALYVYVPPRNLPRFIPVSVD